MTSRKATHPFEALIPTTTRDPLVVVPIGEEDLVRNTQQQKMRSFKKNLEKAVIKWDPFWRGSHLMHKVVVSKFFLFFSRSLGK